MNENQISNRTDSERCAQYGIVIRERAPSDHCTKGEDGKPCIVTIERMFLAQFGCYVLAVGCTRVEAESLGLAEYHKLANRVNRGRILR